MHFLQVFIGICQDHSNWLYEKLNLTLVSWQMFSWSQHLVPLRGAKVRVMKIAVRRPTSDWPWFPFPEFNPHHVLFVSWQSSKLQPIAVANATNVLALMAKTPMAVTKLTLLQQSSPDGKCNQPHMRHSSLVNCISPIKHTLRLADKPWYILWNIPCQISADSEQLGKSLRNSHSGRLAIRSTWILIRKQIA